MQALAIELRGLFEKRTCSQLVGVRDAIAVGVGARFNHAIGCNANHHGSRAAGPSGARADFVAASSQFGADIGRDALVQQQIATVPGMIVKARYQMPGLKARRFHRRLGVLAEIDHVEEQLDQALFLVVPAGSRQREERLCLAR